MNFILKSLVLSCSLVSIAMQTSHEEKIILSKFNKISEDLNKCLSKNPSKTEKCYYDFGVKMENLDEGFPAEFYEALKK